MHGYGKLKNRHTFKSIKRLCAAAAAIMVLIMAAAVPVYAADAAEDSTQADGEQADYDELLNPEKSDTNTCKVIIEASFPDHFQIICPEDAYVLLSSPTVTVTGTVAYKNGYERTVYVPEGNYVTGGAGIYSDDSGDYKVNASPESFTAKKGSPVTVTLSLENEEEVKKKIADEYAYKENRDKDLGEAQKKESEEYQKVQQQGGTPGKNVVEEGSGISTSEWSSVEKAQEAETFLPATESYGKNETAGEGYTGKEPSESTKPVSIINILTAAAGAVAVIVAVTVIIKTRRK